MKMLNLSIPFTFAFTLVAFLSTGCSTDVAGTAEEQNEFKELAEAESSSSTGNDTPVSSATIQSSNSIIVSSSSNNNQSAPIGDLDTNSLSYYLYQYGITDVAFDSKVLASTTTYKENSSAPPQSSTNPEHDGDTKPGTAAATEFDGPGFHPFVKQNIGALEYYFPEAYQAFPELIADIKNDNVQDSCGLYMLNTYTESQFVGQIVTEVKGDSVTVLDIKADACQTDAKIDEVRFLVNYCGKIDRNPEIVHKVVDANIPNDKCPQVNPVEEWVK